jgi:hypothetical protein
LTLHWRSGARAIKIILRTCTGAESKSTAAVSGWFYS